MSDLPANYDNWKTHDPSGDGDLYDTGKITVTMSMKDAQHEPRLRELVQAQGFDVEQVVENPSLPGQPWMIMSMDSLEDHPNDFEHRFIEQHIPADALELIDYDSIEIEHSLPDLEPPDHSF